MEAWTNVGVPLIVALLTGGACTMRSLIFTASGLTAGETYTLFMRKNAQIVFSAEL